MYVVLDQFYIKNAGIYPENNVVLESMIICEFETKQSNCAILLFNKKLIDIYYYNTYENHQISAVDMHAEDLESNKLICYPVIQGERINYQNK